MYREISITNFRGFPKFQMSDLGRVNLLVGTNNCGKSTLLEAIELLASFGGIVALWDLTTRRGEHVWHDEERRSISEAAVAHLFHGHNFEMGSGFSISGRTSTGEETCAVQISDWKIGDKLVPFELEYGEESFGPFSIFIEWRSDDNISRLKIPLTTRKGLSARSIYRLENLSDGRAGKGPVRFISTSSLNIQEITRLFNDIVLTSEEDVLVDALRTIEPTIERIASLGIEPRRTLSSRGNIVLKCKGVDQRIPIGTMGDGIWRMLGIAIALVTAENGTLLVDEIDTGLHYSVMADMWRLVERTAERLNVQVFATTHSRDCYESIASIARESVAEKSQVTIQRIERDKAETVSFNERDIVIAAQRGLEVR